MNLRGKHHLSHERNVMDVIMKPLFVDIPTAGKMLGISDGTVQNLIKASDTTGFPKPKKISANRVGIYVKDLESWAASRPDSDLLPPPNTGAKKPRRTMQSPDSQDDQKAA